MVHEKIDWIKIVGSEDKRGQGQRNKRDEKIIHFMSFKANKFHNKISLIPVFWI